LNHAERRPILHGAAGIEPFGLGVEFQIRKVTAYAGETQERGVADAVEDGLT
jgi:hypothetical protein